mgnify:FL=1
MDLYNGGGHRLLILVCSMGKCIEYIFLLMITFFVVAIRLIERAGVRFCLEFLIVSRSKGHQKCHPKVAVWGVDKGGRLGAKGAFCNS